MSNQDPPMENDGRLFVGFLFSLVPVTMLFGMAGAGLGQVSVGMWMFFALFSFLAGWLLFLKD